MPAKTEKQFNLMSMCAYSPNKAKVKCPPIHVAKEYVQHGKPKGLKK
jgi:hypothetical protein